MHVHHLALRTRRLARVVRFYRDVVGLEVVKRSLQGGRTRSVWLDAGGTVLMVERAAREPAIPRGSRELVCFGVRGQKALARARDRVRRHVRIEGETDFTFYFRDPDGRRVGISCFPF